MYSKNAHSRVDAKRIRESPQREIIYFWVYTHESLLSDGDGGGRVYIESYSDGGTEREKEYKSLRKNRRK